MEKRKTVFDYLAQVMIVFGFTMLALNVLCVVLGNSAKDFSAMFELGDQGIPAKIAFQFLCVSALIIGVKLVFFTDMLIKNMPIWLRTICMLAVIIVIIVIFSVAFSWFPVDRWQSWAAFLISFGLSFLGSYLVVVMKEKIENRKMEEALRRIKEKEATK